MLNSIKNFFSLSKWSLEDKFLGLLLIAFFVIILIRTSWLSDDAYIGFRTVDNFVHGFGLTWNTADRVQVYTNPLWILLMSLFSFITRDVYFTAIIASIILAVFAIHIGLFKQHNTIKIVALSLILLISSKSFVEYSTSGLENTLLHFLMSVFLYLYFCYQDKQRLFWMTLVASGLLLTRQDVLLIIFPLLAVEYYREKIPLKRKITIAILGLSPLILWEVFSLIYYGYPVPNTAFAKLNNNLPQIWLVKQGMKYILATLSLDPVTMITIAAVFVSTFILKIRKLYPIMIGTGLYIIYIMRIGGDQMIGRYFSILIFIAAVCLPNILSKIKLSRTTYFILLVGFGLSSLLSPTPTILSNADYKYYGVLDELQTHDERGFFYYRTSLLRMKRDMKINAGWAEDGKKFKREGTKVVIYGNIGYVGYFAGPTVHIIDYLTLPDPLLSHIPADIEKSWLIGHFRRTLPCGYQETVESGQNQICDPSLNNFYDKVHIITSGKLFSIVRLNTIVKMNLKGYDYLVDEYVSRHPELFDRTEAAK